MKVKLVRDDSGLYALFRLPPTRDMIMGTQRRAWFCQLGEPVAVRQLCELIIFALYGRSLPPDEMADAELLLVDPHSRERIALAMARLQHLLDMLDAPPTSAPDA